MSPVVNIDRATGRVYEPIPSNIVPALKGTEEGHYFPIALDTRFGLVGVRQLRLDVGDLDAVRNGDETRIRFEEKDGPNQLTAVVEALGFTRKPAGHLSVVTLKADSALEAISAALEVIS